MKRNRFNILCTVTLGLALGTMFSGCSTRTFYNTVIRDTPIDWGLGLTRYVLGGSMDSSVVSFRVPRPSYFQVVTEPPGARVTLDGKEVGRSPCSVEETKDPLGHLYEIRASLPGYQDAVATYVNRPPYPAIKDTFLRLRPLTRQTGTPSAVPGGKGTVSITSVPAEAEILIDGALVGNSPCTVVLDTGTHSVAVNAPGYKSFECELRVFDGACLSLGPRLQPQDE